MGAVVILAAIAIVSAAAGAILGRGSARVTPAAVHHAAAAQGRPNVLVVETDDQTVEEMKAMSDVNSLLAKRGVTFENNFVNFSLCCPSRATFLTGEYAHNHGILKNGFKQFESLHGRNNLAVWLHRAGYYTGLIGKYLNGFGHRRPRLVPPGWSFWFSGIGKSTLRVYNYTMDANGRLVHYGTRPRDFKQDVLTRRAVRFVRRRAPKRKPFFLWLTYTSPHVAHADTDPNPPTDCQKAARPAPRDAHAFDSAPLPMPPNFNEAHVSDKPKQIRDRPSLTGSQIAAITRKYRCELESLLSVDRGVKRLVDTLRSAGELGRTYVVFTSDNGYFHGEHRIPAGKTKLYEESIRVPLVIRGPGIPPGRTVRDLAINADLAPTILDATGARPGLKLDGHSLLGAARHPTRETGRELEIETPTYRAIRTQRYIYATYDDGERELYDLAKDPYELHNLDHARGYRRVRRHLARRLHRLRHCAGRSCLLRPHLKLELRHRTRRVGGHRCAAPPIRAVLAGRNTRSVVKAGFYVDGRFVAVDTHAPFRYKLSHAHGPTTVRLRASLIDGRRMTTGAKVRACG